MHKKKHERTSLNIGILLVLLTLTGTVYGADKSMEKRMLQLEEDNKTLKKDLQEVKAELQTQQLSQTLTNDKKTDANTPAASYSGQYRINSYSADNDVGGDRQTANRVRIRQSIDIIFDKQLKTYLQLEMGNTASNVTTSS